MPLKVSCPHCHKSLVAKDEAAGRRQRCPACRQSFDVPLPVGAPVARADVASRCPRCGAPAAPGTTICRKCSAVIATGKRLPLRRRLLRLSVKSWTLVGLSLVGAVLLVYIGVSVYLARFSGSGDTEPVFHPVSKSPFAAEEWATRLFAAESSAEREAARDKLIYGGANAPRQVAGAIATALETSLNKPSAALIVRHQRLAAIAILENTAIDLSTALREYGPLLESCAELPELRDRANCTRAVFGDERMLGEMKLLWQRTQRRHIFLMRQSRLSSLQNSPALHYMLWHTSATSDTAARGLLSLQQRDESDVLGMMLECYWSSWSWLGHTRGASLATELFEFARIRQHKPGANAEKRSVKEARDLLLRVGGQASPAALAAAGVVLTQSTPQFRAARQSTIDQLVKALPACPPATQQQLGWTIVRLTGRQFGQATQQSHPLDIQANDLTAILRWARDNGMIDDLTDFSDQTYPTRPRLTYQAISRERQFERDLLQQLQQGWHAAGTAMDQWSEADIGCTPRLLLFLDPGQRAPNYPALAAAMVIVAECHEQSARPMLALWHEASDQPQWVRQLAYAALGALDAGTPHWASGWPAGFDPGSHVQLDRGQPGWNHYGRVLAAGGPAMIARTKSYKPAPLNAQLRDRLLEAAEYAARRRSLEDQP
ncbi:MAG: zinc ribbon domain-containing protein [Planctomycetota bacterium]